MADLLWGIDLGGTKIEGVVTSRESPTSPLVRLRVPTESDRGYQHVLSQVRGLLESMAQAVGSRPKVVGFGTPGTVDPQSKTLKNSNTLCLNKMPLGADLSTALGVDVRISNDANCFALAEAQWGAGKGAQVVFGVILGTGVGGGIVVDGRVWGGAQGNGGEWGHNVLIEGGTPCYCGKAGCVEGVISGPALETWYAERSGERRSLNEIFQRAEEGSDAAAQQTRQRLCSEFGRAISVVINILDPEVIVLGGGVSRVSDLYVAGIESAKKYVFNDRFDTKIVQHELGDSAGVYGAAALSQ